MNKRIVMQALAGVFALGVGTALAGPETTKPADPAQPMRPSAGTTVPTPTPTPPPPSPTGTTGTTTATSAPAGGTLTASEQKQAKRVLNDIHNVNALEITLGRLAQQKAESQAIKDYAQMLVTDHESADKKVMDFASANSIMLSSNVSGITGQPSTATDAGTRAGMGPAATGAQGATGTAKTTAGTNPAAGTGNSPATAGAVPPTTDVPPLELAPADQKKVAKLEKLEGAKFEKAFLTEMVKGHKQTLGKLKGAEKSAKNAELKALLGDISTSVQMHLDKAKELQRPGSASL
jgi:predicted outer membrane protein